MSTENVVVGVDEGGPGHDMSVEVTAKYRADGGIDILSVRELPQAGEYEMPDPTTRPEDDPYSVGREERPPAQAGGGKLPSDAFGRPHGVEYDRLGWICSVCNGWNHSRDRLCTHTHHNPAPAGEVP